MTPASSIVLSSEKRDISWAICSIFPASLSTHLMSKSIWQFWTTPISPISNEMNKKVLLLSQRKEVLTGDNDKLKSETKS